MIGKILMAQIKEEIYYLVISHRLIPDKQKECSKGKDVQKNYYILINMSSTSVKQNKKPSYGPDGPQKRLTLWIPPKLGYSLSQNVQNTRRNHKAYWDDHENLESEIDDNKKKLSWGKDPTVHGLHQTVCPKQKRIGNPYTVNKHIQSDHRNII